MNATANSEITMEVCSNTEWLRENAGLNLELIEDGMEDEAANRISGILHATLEAAGYQTVSAKGQRTTYHGWNGANTFKHLLGPVGTFDALTPEQIDEIIDITCAAAKDAAGEFAKEAV